MFVFLLSGLLATSFVSEAQKKGPLRPSEPMLKLIENNLKQACSQYKILKGRLPAGRFPKTYFIRTGRMETGEPDAWTSGFYPGTLMYLYQFSKDTSLSNEALQRMKLLEKNADRKDAYDLGFLMYNSYGNAQRLLPSPEYAALLQNSARALAADFNAKVGAIRSRETGKWQFPVTTDGLANLELLFWAARSGGDPALEKIAITHANTTLLNQFRPDYSSYDVVDYDTTNGQVVSRKTARGYADTSAWSRGQAWGLYGFTMLYRFTRDSRYLDQAVHIADFISGNPHLPVDKIPYWDFNAPPFPVPLRDASSAAIMCSALLELCGYTDPKKGQEYVAVAEQIIRSLSFDPYKALVGENGGFLLKHSVGNMPARIEVDVPETYADYYFVEAMMRYRQLGEKRSW